jgi:L-ascorbate metabolism protein UlaG (beta-lactamase superfamily)
MRQQAYMRKILKAGKILLIILAILPVITYFFMQQASFGTHPNGTRLERIQKSPNYKDGTFQNLEKTEMMAPDASYTRLFWKFFTNSDTLVEPVMALPTIKTNLKALPQDQPVMVWFGHSSYLLSIDGKKILVDPVFSQRPSPVQYAGSKSFLGTMVYTPADFPDLDLVIITHDHYDHLDYATIQQLKSKTKLFCTALGVGTHLEHWGIEPDRIREFDWWEGDTVQTGITLTATPARHFSGRGFRRNRTLWASYVLKVGGKTIFIGGDSGYDAAFKNIGETFGPFDIAMVECGQYNVYWPYIHMMPEQTVQAAVDLNTKVLMPVHWGKFRLAMHPWKEPIERAIKQAEKLNVGVTTPQIGEVIHLNGTLPNTKWWENYK